MNPDFWTREISNFLLDAGVVSTYPEPEAYITDEYIKNIRDDPYLAAFARGGKSRYMLALDLLILPHVLSPSINSAFLASSEDVSGQSQSYGNGGAGGPSGTGAFLSQPASRTVGLFSLLAALSACEVFL
jgi:hypothetical protein